MNGALIIDKPAGMTSHDVVSRVRRITGERRIGHIGTLDPFATGVLVLLLGKATRLARFFDHATKSYEAVMRVGFSTDTYDATGAPSGADRGADFRPADLHALLPEFQGTIQQLPPAYSAKKIAGVAAYKKARKGQAVELAPVTVTISELQVLQVDGPLVKFSVTVSSGTYIRSLAHDLGSRLSLGAHLQELRRTRLGAFTIAEALTVKQLEDPAQLAGAVRPMEALLPEILPHRLTTEELSSVLHGRSVAAEQAGEWLRLLTPLGELAAMARLESPGWYHPEVVLYEAVPEGS